MFCFVSLRFVLFFSLTPRPIRPPRHLSRTDRVHTRRRDLGVLCRDRGDVGLGKALGFQKSSCFARGSGSGCDAASSAGLLALCVRSRARARRKKGPAHRRCEGGALAVVGCGAGSHGLNWHRRRASKSDVRFRHARRRGEARHRCPHRSRRGEEVLN